ncbi:MAG: hypothetical protein PSX71_06060 [bacterium]|nr:hypothetical protein [bacterium]
MNKQEHAFSHWLFTILAALFLTACGGGGSGGLLDLQGVSTYKLGVTSSSTTLGPSGSVLISATLTDSASVAAAGQTIHFSSTGEGALSAISAVTNASGVATVTLNGNGGAGAGAVKASYTDSGNNIVKSGISYTIVNGDNVSLSLSKNTVKSGSGDSVTLTAFVTDSSGVSQAGKLVIFGGAGAPNGSITIANGGITDTNGLVTATYFPDTTDRSNKAVVVTASAGTAVASGTINITGTTIKLTPSVTSTTINSSINLDATVTDGNGVAIGGQAITLTSPNFAGGQLTTLPTDPNGKIPTQTVLITSAPGGIAAFTASGLGATASTSVAVSGTSFSFTTPNTLDDPITVSTGKVVSVTHLNNTVPVAGETIYFSTSLGTMTPSSAVTNGAGVATSTLSSASAGQAVISANTAGAALQVSHNVLFVGGTPTQISLQAGQKVLAELAQTQITATVLDAANNPVKDKVVLFTAVANPSGGTGLSAALATTDAGGRASVTYTAGTSTPTNGVQIRASVQGFPAVTTHPNTGSTGPFDAELTVGGTAVFISIASGNTINVLDPTTYADPHSVLVTDSSGGPMKNQLVTLSVIPIDYYKGTYVKTGSGWAASHSAACANEDLDSDGILDPGEDTNVNGRLDPGNPVTLSSATVTTNDSGFASFSVLYGKNVARWLYVNLRVTAQVNGTESKAELKYVLPVLASDVSDETVSPPGGVQSQFGIAAVCTNPN